VAGTRCCTALPLVLATACPLHPYVLFGLPPAHLPAPPASALAQRCVPIFARELHCPDDALRLNALMALCELCSHHTSLADRYIPQLATRLQDSAPLVRHAALSLLAALVQVCSPPSYCSRLPTCAASHCVNALFAKYPR